MCIAEEGSNHLSLLSSKVANCERCPLAQTRTRSVFGAGNEHARVLLVGEAPGKNEDMHGIPFVGKAGQNLDALLDKVGLVREDLYIANVVKCRPPANRNPRAEEIEACAPYLREQINAVGPEFIVTLGNFATRFFLDTKDGISRVRGKVYRVKGFKVFPVYHPAAAMYDRKKQAVLETDFAHLAHLLETSV